MLITSNEYTLYHHVKTYSQKVVLKSEFIYTFNGFLTSLAIK